MPWDDQGQWYGECSHGQDCEQGWLHSEDELGRYWAQHCSCLDEEIVRRRERKRARKLGLAGESGQWWE